MNILMVNNKWQLVGFNNGNYKIINGNKCYFEYVNKQTAINKFNQIIGGLK